MSKASTNVLGKPHSFFQDGTGFHHDGYCRTGGQATNDISRDYKGISAGEKTCISAHDFKACIKEMGPDMGPEVHLSATDERALEVASLSEMKRYATKEE